MDFEPQDEQTMTRLWSYDGPDKDTYGVCAVHFHATHDEEGNVVLSPAGKHAARKEQRLQPKLTRGEAQRLYRTRIRDELIKLLGGECRECPETDTVLLRVVWLDQTRPEHLTGTGLVEWHRTLIQDKQLRTRASLRCVAHSVVVTSGVREQAIERYGGACVGCGGTESLWVVPQPRTQVPRYPGGKKMGSKDKLRWLARAGFPDGWELRCSRCAHRGEDL